VTSVSDFWNQQARLAADTESLWRTANIIVAGAQLWDTLTQVVHGKPANSAPFRLDRNWRVVIARWEDNDWRWPDEATSPAGAAQPGDTTPPDDSDGAPKTSTSARGNSDAAEKSARATGPRKTEAPRPPWTNAPRVVAAAWRLGVEVTATADEVRAAMRKKMVTANAHPDQGGDPAVAKEIIAAKNLLIERINKERHVAG
jgi:hypothetical protein